MSPLDDAKLCAGMNGIADHIILDYARQEFADELGTKLQILDDPDKSDFIRSQYRSEVIEQARNKSPDEWQFLMKPGFAVRMMRLLDQNFDGYCIVLREPVVFGLAVKMFGHDRTMMLTDNKYVASWFRRQTKNGTPIFQNSNGEPTVHYTTFDDELAQRLPQMISNIKMQQAKPLAHFLVGSDGHCFASDQNQSRVLFIGNPPYQRPNGNSSAIAIYPKFVDHALQHGDEVLFVIPAKWYATGKGKDVEVFREDMLKSGKVKQLVDLENERVFADVEIAGGVCFLHATNKTNPTCRYTTNGKTHDVDLRRYDVLVSVPDAYPIIDKVVALHNDFMSDTCGSQTPFGLITSFDKFESEDQATTVPCLTRSGTKPVDRQYITRGHNILDRWKVVISEANGAANQCRNGARRVIQKARVLPPGHCCTQTYLIVAHFDTEEKANNCVQYLSCKLPRFMLGLRKKNQHVSPTTFSWVPNLDFSRSYTDEALYNYFQLSDAEISFIEKTIKCL